MNVNASVDVPITESDAIDILEKPKPTTLQKNVEASIVMTLLTIADTIIKNGDVVCQRMGITTQQWRIMLHLASDPNLVFVQDNPRTEPIVASELADALNVSRPNITNLINSLTEKGMVLQITDKRDKRKKFLTLSEEGLRVLEIIEPFRRRANLRLMTALSDDGKQVLLHSLRGCLDILTADFGKLKGSFSII